MPIPLYGNNNMGQLQNNGYKSTVSAISEIVDNSIQWKAKNIQIVLIKNTTVDRNEIEEILIIDDGVGMDKAGLTKAVQFNSGSNAGARKGLGKYGMGLPSASVSVTKRTEIYTRMNRKKLLFNYIDLDEIERENVAGAMLPDVIEVDNYNLIPVLNNGIIVAPDKGTIVRWVKPNNVNPKTVRTIVGHLQKALGRFYRYYINGFDIDGETFKTDIKVFVIDFNGTNYALDNNYGKSIVPFDPMFLMEKTQMLSEFPDIDEPTSELLGESSEKEFMVPCEDGDVKTVVKIRFSTVKKKLRQDFGRSAGTTPFGKMYLKRNIDKEYANISIIRAGREIDQGSFGFITSVSDERNRWWSAEVVVEPVLDLIVGVDNKKQQASNIRFIDSKDNTYGDAHEIVKWISDEISENVRTVKRNIDEQNANKKGKSGLIGPLNSEKTGPRTREDEIIRVKLTDWIRERFPTMEENELSENVKYALEAVENHIFIPMDLGDTTLFAHHKMGSLVIIQVNQNHCFYKKCIQPLEGDPARRTELSRVRLIISAMVDSEISNQTTDNELIKDRRTLRNTMFVSLDSYIADLDSYINHPIMDSDIS